MLSLPSKIKGIIKEFFFRKCYLVEIGKSSIKQRCKLALVKTLLSILHIVHINDMLMYNHTNCIKENERLLYTYICLKAIDSVNLKKVRCLANSEIDVIATHFLID